MTTTSAGITQVHGMIKDTLPQLMTSGDVRQILVRVMDTGKWETSFFYHDDDPLDVDYVDGFLAEANGVVLAHRLFEENGYCSAMLETYCLDTGVTESFALVRDEKTSDTIEINEASETWYGPLKSWVFDRVEEP